MAGHGHAAALAVLNSLALIRTGVPPVADTDPDRCIVSVFTTACPFVVTKEGSDSLLADMRPPQYEDVPAKAVAAETGTSAKKRLTRPRATETYLEQAVNILHAKDTAPLWTCLRDLVPFVDPVVIGSTPADATSPSMPLPVSVSLSWADVLRPFLGHGAYSDAIVSNSSRWAVDACVKKMQAEKGRK